jgi:predicted TIM-barrel fold metal-dependent hydrolase
MADLNWMISVDDHLFEPPDTWVKEAPAALRDRVPRTLIEDGVTYWIYEHHKVPISGVLVQAGRATEEINPAPVSYDEMLPAYYDPVARLEYMNRDGVLASLCFPFFPRFCGQAFYEAKDKALALWCVQRYNDFVVDEWAGAAPGRYLPLAIIPLWDPRAAAKEIERAAAKGAKAIAFSENPSKLGLPSLHAPDNYWDPVFAAADETRLPLAIHFGSSSSVPTTSDDAPLLVTGALSPISLAFCFTDWIFSGILPRFPNLKLLMSEGGIGWIPYMIERCESIYRTQEWTRTQDFRYDLGSGAGSATGRGGFVMEETPRQLFERHIYGCFIEDYFGASHLEEVGFDNVLIETDFPHGDSSYPHSMKSAREQLGRYPEDLQYKVLQGNARKLFDFTPAEPPAAHPR